MMEQNDKLINAITKGTYERNEIQREKVKLAKMKQENKIIFTDLSLIFDPTSCAYIEIEIKTFWEKTQTNYEEHGEGFQYHYHGSQYQTSHYQRDQWQNGQYQGE